MSKSLCCPGNTTQLLPSEHNAENMARTQQTDLGISLVNPGANQGIRKSSVNLIGVNPTEQASPAQAWRTTYSFLSWLMTGNNTHHARTYTHTVVYV